MTRQQLIDAVRETARRLGVATLKYGDFYRETKVTDYWVRTHFDSWTELCAAAGIEPARVAKLADDDIFAAMIEAFEQLGGIGPRYKFARHFPYSADVLRARWPDWVAAQAALRDWALVRAPGFRYMAELELSIARGPRAGPRVAGGTPRPRATAAEMRAARAALRAEARPPPLTAAKLEDEPRRAEPLPERVPDVVADSVPDRVADAVSEPAPESSPGRLPVLVGDVIGYRGIIFAPVNEMGVVMLFAAAAPALGFAIESSGVPFPDCVVWQRVAPGRWARRRVELEYASSNFRLHRHDAKGCELVVCWEHDWPACPVKVLDLKKEIARLKGEEM